MCETRNHPEGCIVECYIAEEAIEFCTEYLSNMDAIRVPSSTNVDHKVGAPIPGGFQFSSAIGLIIRSSIKVDEFGLTLVDFTKMAHKSDPFILASQAKQVFYVQDQLDPRWSVVLSTPQRDFFKREDSDDFMIILLNTILSLPPCHKLNHLIQWMTLCHLHSRRL
ncbi:hypothetical protein CK203_019589 [Vitis vinifera]|uniref:DUF4218 domain-containing protein n=1 Tax=Vitis vinifera TaxID=29760 RepID=A0A438JR04_VITVI|nr:hypothetical protein CK203_019589 [Vitis vinifera]